MSEPPGPLGLIEPSWGPAEPDAGVGGHPIGAGSCRARAGPDGVSLEGGRIDAIALAGGRVLRTAEPDLVQYGIAQVRRLVGAGGFSLAHVLFAPGGGRPLLLSLVRLENAGDAPLIADYSETWDVLGGEYRAWEGACERRAEGGARALADASFVIRSRPPPNAGERGLSLDLRLVLGPGSRRQLAFAYVVAEPGEEPAAMVRAWRGAVAKELDAVVAAWLERLGPDARPVIGYRRACSV
jgi:hypothetical protein